jgi:ElaB/YqjD/DUF883 family membrane-anchored ribosome-binding protein
MPTVQDRIDELADHTSQAARDAKRVGNQALDRLACSAADWRDEAAPVVDRLSDRASQAARQGADWVRDNSGRVRQQVAKVSDRTVGYVRDEPVRTVLMAAAAGAVIYAFVRLLSSRNER